MANGWKTFGIIAIPVVLLLMVVILNTPDPTGNVIQSDVKELEESVDQQVKPSYIEQQLQIYDEFMSEYRSHTSDLESLNNKEISDNVYLKASQKTLAEYNNLVDRFFRLNPPENYFPYHERALKAYNLDILSIRYDIRATEAFLINDYEEGLRLHDKSTDYFEQAGLEWDGAFAAAKNAIR